MDKVRAMEGTSAACIRLTGCYQREILLGGQWPVNTNLCVDCKNTSCFLLLAGVFNVPSGAALSSNGPSILHFSVLLPLHVFPLLSLNFFPSLDKNSIVLDWIIVLSCVSNPSIS